jgi:pimeloyl-ACP methyl ester carboxylesterase
MPNLPLSAAAAFALSSLGHAQNTPAALAHDPAPDKTFPAAMQTVQIPSQGALLNGFVYLAAGAGPHPVVILLHGFPGNERNLDLAQAIRRAGWDVLYFNYRGSWGTPGAFSFSHSIEDTAAAVAWLHDPAIVKHLRADPQKIVLIGHSMGGFMAAYAGAQDSSIRAVGLISAANFGGMALTAKAHTGDTAAKDIASHLAAEGMAPLAGCTPESLAHELLEHGTAWNISALGPKLASRPVLIITSDDGSQPSSAALAEGLAKAGDTDVKQVHMATDHPYSDHRIALEQTVLEWIATLP